MSLLLLAFYICLTCSTFIDYANLQIAGDERTDSKLLNLTNSDMTYVSIQNQDRFEFPTVYILSSYMDIILPKNKDLMKDNNNILYFKMIDSIVYYDRKNSEWQEMKFANFTPESIVIKKYKELIPVTYCLDSITGSGGTISSSYQITILVTDEYYNTIEASLALTLSAVLGVSVNPTLSYSSSYSCSIDKGQVGRLYIEPYYVDIPSLVVRKVSYSSDSGIIGLDNDFEEVDGLKLLTKYKPNHYCVLEFDSDKLDCDNPIDTSYFTIN